MSDAIHPAAARGFGRSGTPTSVAGRAIPTLQSVLFGPLREQTFASEQVVDGDGLADRVASISFVAAMEEAARAALLEEVRALTRGGTVALRYVVELQLARRIPWFEALDMNK